MKRIKHNHLNCFFKKLSFILLLLSTGLTRELTAQIYPVDIDPVGMIGSGTIYLSDLAHPEATANKVNFLLRLNDPDPLPFTREVSFRVYIKLNGRLIMQTRQGFIPPVTFFLTNGIPTRISGSDLYYYFQIENLESVSDFPVRNELQEDTYEICIAVVDVLRQVIISEVQCVEGYLAQVEPPVLFSPFDEQELSFGQSSNLMFVWQLPRNPQPGIVNISYYFELRELADGFENAQEYFENNTLIYRSEPLMGNSFIYRLGLPPLVPEKKYVWRVQAVAGDIMDPMSSQYRGYFVNNGFSEIWSFTLPDDFRHDSYFCSARIPKLPQNLNTISSLSPDDIIHVGDFDLVITSVQNSNGGALSGTGTIFIPFLDIEVETSFDNLQVNTKREVFGGQIKVVRENSWLSKISPRANGTLSFDGVGPLTEEDIANVTVLSRDIKSDAANKLPISLEPLLLESRNVTMPFDLIVNEMSFAPEGATFNAVMMVPDGSGGYAKFGKSAIRMDDSGFDIAELKLFLAEHATMPGFDNDLVHIVAKPGETEPERGSFIYFDCTGFQGFNLQGNYRFNKEILVRASNVNVPATASFYINSKNWGHIMADMVMQDFAIPGMEGWRFEVLNGKVDFSKDENIQGIKLPNNYVISDNQWRGFYLPNLRVTLPQELKFGKNGAIEMMTRDMVIDAEGVSFSGKGYDLMPIGVANAGGWGLSFKELQLNIAKNAFEDADIKGKVVVLPIQDTIDYEGKIFKGENVGGYALDLMPLDDIDIPFLNATIEPDAESVISIRQETPYCVAEWRPYANINGALNVLMPEEAFAQFGGSEITPKMIQIKDSLRTDSEFAFELSGIALKGFKINHPKLPEGRFFGIDRASIPTGGVSLADIKLTVEGVDLLEEAFELNGKQPGLGLGFHLSLNTYGINPRFWALNASEKEAGPYSLAKIEIDVPKVPKKAFACECKPASDGSAGHDYCQSPTPYRESAVLQVGRTIQVGHFNMEITALAGNNGTGKIAIPYLGGELAVEFENVVIDDRGMLMQGKVQSSLGAPFVGIKAEALQSERGVLAMRSISDGAAFVQQLNSHMKDMNNDFLCPLSIGKQVQQLLPIEHDGNFEFIVMGVNFGADVARVNCMALFTTPEGHILKFGLGGLDMRPDGFNLDGLNMFLTEESVIAAYDGKPIKLITSQPGDPESGSYISFDCDGFNSFHLKGLYTFDPMILVNADNSATPVEAYLDITTTAWDDFEATVKMSPFAIPGLDGWSFEALEAGADFSDTRNLLGMQFPLKYSTANPAWQGFFVSRVRVIMPDDLKFGGVKTLSFDSENLLIDRSGVSGLLKGLNVCAVNGDKKDQWSMSINEMELHLRHNQFVDAVMHGLVWAPAMQSAIGYTGRLYVEPVSQEAPHGFYALDMSPYSIKFSNNYEVEIASSQESLLTLLKRPMFDLSGQPVFVNKSPVYTYKPYSVGNTSATISLPKNIALPVRLKSSLSGTASILNGFGLTKWGDYTVSGFDVFQLNFFNQLNRNANSIELHLLVKPNNPPNSK